jgi:hypothetical protein
MSVSWMYLPPITKTHTNVDVYRSRIAIHIPPKTIPDVGMCTVCLMVSYIIPANWYSTIHEQVGSIKSLQPSEQGTCVSKYQNNTVGRAEHRQPIYTIAYTRSDLVQYTAIIRYIHVPRRTWIYATRQSTELEHVKVWVNAPNTTIKQLHWY